MNSSNEGHGTEIRALLAELRPTAIAGLSTAGCGPIREAQRRIDESVGKLHVLRHRRTELVDERSWIDAEVHGFERALALIGREGMAGESNSLGGAGRLHARLGRRVERSQEITAEMRGIDRRIGDLEAEIVSVQKEMLAALRPAVANARAKATARQAAAARAERAAARRLTLDQAGVEAMWSPTAVMAYRVWLLDKDGLYGSRRRWESARLAARCRVPGELPHTDGRCAQVAFGCGIYAAKSSLALMRSVGGTARGSFAVGLVGLEGKVVEHERGYRAGRATVLALVIVHQTTMRMIEEAAEIEQAFINPFTARPFACAPSPAPADVATLRLEIAGYLEAQAQRRQSWTSGNQSV